ncbi:MAG: AsmA family protein, partial [Gammaproteobacteria bacterium]|nr:AsmA family protein [Gammaproteobacteria bacterium]
PLLLKIVGGVVAITVIAIGVLVATVDPNDYRDEITDLVKEETGRDLEIDSLSLSLFPQIGLNLENTTLSNAEGFSDQPFIQIDKIQLGAAILPLLSQSLEIDTLTLHGLALTLEKNAEGVSNWDDLVKSTDETDAKSDSDETDPSDPLEKLAGLNFGGIDILNATVHWKDQQAGQEINLALQNFTTGAMTFGTFFPIELIANTHIKSPDVTAKVQLSIEAKLEKSGAYALRNLSLKTSTSGAGIPVTSATTELTIPTLDLQLADQKINLASLTLAYDVVGGADFPMQTLQGQLQLTDLTGDLATQAFQAQSLSMNTELTGETLPNGQLSTVLSMQPSLNLSAQTASLKQLSLTAMNLKATGSVEMTQLTTDAQVKAQLKVAETNLRTLMTQLKIALPQMADSKTLTKFAADIALQFSAKQEKLTLSKLAITLDESQLTGNASVSHFNAPNIRYSLALNKIDLNRYLPPKKETAETTSEKGDADLEIKLPVELLRSLTVNGTVKVGDLTIDKLHPKNLLLTVKGSQGKLTASPIRADIFATRINAQAGVDVRGKTQKFTVKFDTKKLPVGEVLQAVADMDTLSGTGTVNVNIRTAGTKVSHFKQNLNGTASVNLENGAVKGINLAQSIREAQAKLSGKPVPKTNEPLQTDFSTLIAQVSIKQGVVTTKKLSALAPYMRINGSGTVNLPKETLKYLVKAKIVGSDKGQGGQSLSELSGLTIPVKLTGKYTDPSISLDLNSLLESKAKAELEKKKDEVVQDLQKDLQKQLKGSLFKGFGF